MSAVALAVLGACAAEAAPDLGDTTAAVATPEHVTERGRLDIVGGEPSISDPAVVALLRDGEQFCSGALVARTIVLTAAHCLPPYNRTTVAHLSVYIGDDITRGGTEIAVVDATPHPKWDIALLGYDIGLVQLARAAPVDPLPLSKRSLTPDDEGAPVRLVGYGVAREGSPIHGERRTGYAVIDAIDSFSMYTDAEPATTCNGDSGGPALMVRNGIEIVAGVHSRSDCSTRAVEERVDIHLEQFIERYVAAASTCNPDDECASPCEFNYNCAVPCERDGQCERLPSRYQPTPGGCNATSSGSTGGGATAAAILALLAYRRRRASRSRAEAQNGRTW